MTSLKHVLAIVNGSLYEIKGKPPTEVVFSYDNNTELADDLIKLTDVGFEVRAKLGEMIVSLK